MTYNKAEIMMQAWSWFNNEDIWTSDIEWMDYTVTEKTFAACLKASWAKAKEQIEESKKEATEIAKSEEVKAWNWAAKKVGLVIEMSDKQKYQAVLNEMKNVWPGKSTFALAMKAVKRLVA